METTITRIRSFSWVKRNRFLLSFFITVSLTYYLFGTPMVLHEMNEMKDMNETNEMNEISETINFDNFDNFTGSDHWIVPNIIHFIYFNKNETTFTDYIVIRAAMRNHRPDKFYIHSNIQNLTLTGKYWDWVCKDVELRKRIEFHYLEMPYQIYGRNLSVGWRNHHAGDIGRLRVLMKYGGIYLDNDDYVIQNLDKYRKYEFVVNWDEKQFMGTQVYIAHKNARVIPKILETYREYDSTKWYYNAGERPTTEVLMPHPELIHRVKGAFGADTGISGKLYNDLNFQWRKLDVVHLMMRHRNYIDRDNFNKIGEFNETNIQNYKYPFGEMAREVMDKSLIVENLKFNQTEKGNSTRRK